MCLLWFVLEEVLCEAAPEEHEALEAFRRSQVTSAGASAWQDFIGRWSVVLVAKILVRVIEEGATIAETLSVRLALDPPISSCKFEFEGDESN